MKTNKGIVKKKKPYAMCIYFISMARMQSATKEEFKGAQEILDSARFSKKTDSRVLKTDSRVKKRIAVR